MKTKLLVASIAAALTLTGPVIAQQADPEEQTVEQAAEQQSQQSNTEGEMQTEPATSGEQDNVTVVSTDDEQPEQDAEEQQPEEQDQQATEDSQQTTQQPSYSFRATDLIGQDIENAEGDEIGEVEDLIITDDDTILMAVVSVGGFLGIGDKKVAIPYDELTLAEDGEQITFNATKEELEARPEFQYADDQQAQAEQPSQTDQQQQGVEQGVPADAAQQDMTDQQEDMAEEQEEVQEQQQELQEAEQEGDAEDVQEQQEELQEAEQEAQQNN